MSHFLRRCPVAPPPSGYPGGAAACRSHWDNWVGGGGSQATLNMYVRCGVGRHAATGTDTYRVCEIVGHQDGSKRYQVQSVNGKTKVPACGFYTVQLADRWQDPTGQLWELSGEPHDKTP